MTLYEELNTYTPCNMQEEADRKVMLRYLTDFSNVYTRDNVYGHITSSPWIINADTSKVLMIYHNIYDSWGWCGGHADGDQDLIHVALKEGKEETGLKKLQLLSESILAIDILPVLPARKPQKIQNFSKKGLRFAYKYDRIIHVAIPGVAQLVARLTGGQEAVSSSLATRTSFKTA